jgi:co-chaperonin GroES (HSP10)
MAAFYLAYTQQLVKATLYGKGGQMLRPRAGKLLVKRVETNDSAPGSTIVLLEDTRNKMTSGQFEIVAIGEPANCNNEDCERWHAKGSLRRHRVDVQVGAWVLMSPRSGVATDDSSLLLASFDDVLAVLSE